ncbi:GGDEF domain-containing protein [Candidatus Uhrbacteria bacterium]|nr:GGDEF domain-containing protein [Candidatus Uhrbacteria bacterium]
MRDLRFVLVYLPAGLLPALLAAFYGRDEIRDRAVPVPLLLGAIASLLVLGVIVSLYRQVERADRLRDELVALASRDPLTGLSNRRMLQPTLARTSRQADRGGTPACLVLMDLDDLKIVNDRMGHAAGDALLVGFARTLRRVTRAQTDLLFRIGGDEFLVVLPGAAIPHARVIAERLLEALAEDTAPVPGVHPRCSIGVAQRHGQERPEAWLRRADLAMYRAKETGAGVEVA